MRIASGKQTAKRVGEANALRCAPSRSHPFAPPSFGCKLATSASIRGGRDPHACSQAKSGEANSRTDYVNGGRNAQAFQSRFSFHCPNLLRHKRVQARQRLSG